MMKKITAVAASLGMLLGTVSFASADSITVENDNNAMVTNAVTVSASTGGNTSRGGSGARGGDAGDATGGGDESSTDAGAGGVGGEGGAGGNITTGDAIGTVVIESDVNSTETVITDNRSDENQYDETLWTRSRIGSSESLSWDDSESFNESYSESSSANHENEWDENESESSSSDSESSDDADSSWERDSSESASDSSSTGSDSHSESWNSDYNQSSNSASSGDMGSEQHNDQDLYYTRTYVTTDNDINVRNANDAAVVNAVAVGAATGDNTSEGGEGDRGGRGGDALGGGDMSDTSGSAGGAGGDGGAGGTVSTGVSDAYADIVTVSGRTVTRITRN